MNYTNIKKEYATKLSVIMENNQVLWAFNNEQLQEGIKKYNISKDNKMVSIGAGGYMPSKNLIAFKQSVKDLGVWEKAAKEQLKKDAKELEAAILYELRNYECFYSGDITEACEALATIDRGTVKSVYDKYKNDEE